MDIEVGSTWLSKHAPHMRFRVTDLVCMNLGPGRWVAGVAYVSVILGHNGHTTFVHAQETFLAEFTPQKDESVG